MDNMMMNKQMPPQAGAQQMPMQPSPQAAQQPPMPELRGEDVQMLLFSRVQNLTEPEMVTLDQMITPETIVVLLKLFPELAILFERASAFQGEQYQGQPQQQAQQEYEQDDEEGGNPLVNNNLSRGLMG